MTLQPALKYVTRFEYGDALAQEIRVDGDFPVFGSNGVVGTHNEANMQGPAIVIGRKGSYGKVTWAEKAGFCIDTAFYVDARYTSANLRWLYWSLQTLGLDEHSEDTGVPGLSREKAYQSKLQLPSPWDQERIANFLDDKTARIDALIAEKERLLTLLSESRESVTELAVTPAGSARVKPLKRVTLRIITGPFGSALHSSEYVEGGVPVINPSHIVGDAVCPDQSVTVTQEMADSLSSYWLSPGELVVGRRGEMGRCAVVPLEGKGWLCGTGSLLATPDTSQVLPDYMQLVVSSRAARDWLSLESVGSMMENLNGEILGRLPGFFPSIADQAARLTRARAALGTHDDLIAHALEHIARLREYRSSLISAAVTGQIDIGSYGVNQ